LTIKIPISTGELIDKITILEIKTQFIKDSGKLEVIFKELEFLSIEYNKLITNIEKKSKKIELLKDELYNVNMKLWEIEDEIRVLEGKQEFNEYFVKLARSVYIYNDKRSEVKNKINLLTESKLSEVKQYPKYKSEDNDK
jgi:uncharacterized UPF0146 family protein